jgi:hypothetical protein
MRTTACVSAVILLNAARVTVGNVVRKAYAKSVARIGRGAFTLRKVTARCVNRLRRILGTNLVGTIAFRHRETIAGGIAASGILLLHSVKTVPGSVAVVNSVTIAGNASVTAR